MRWRIGRLISPARPQPTRRLLPRLGLATDDTQRRQLVVETDLLTTNPGPHQARVGGIDHEFGLVQQLLEALHLGALKADPGARVEQQMVEARGQCTDEVDQRNRGPVHGHVDGQVEPVTALDLANLQTKLGPGHLAGGHEVAAVHDDDVVAPPQGLQMGEHPQGRGAGEGQFHRRGGGLGVSGEQNLLDKRPQFLLGLTITDGQRGATAYRHVRALLGSSVAIADCDARRDGHTRITRAPRHLDEQARGLRLRQLHVGSDGHGDSTRQRRQVAEGELGQVRLRDVHGA